MALARDAATTRASATLGGAGAVQEDKQLVSRVDESQDLVLVLFKWYRARAGAPGISVMLLFKDSGARLQGEAAVRNSDGGPLTVRARGAVGELEGPCDR